MPVNELTPDRADAGNRRAYCHRRAVPIGMHVADGHCAARSCLRHPPCGVGFPRRVLLQRRIALASADARRHPIGHAALPSRNPRLDQPARRAHAASHHDAWPGSGGALPVLPLTVGRPKSLLDIVVAVVARRPFSRVVANSTLDQLASLQPLPNAAHSF